MDPATQALVFFALEQLIKETPAIVADVRALLNKDNPTPEDWAALRAKVAGDSYKALVPNSQLP